MNVIFGGITTLSIFRGWGGAEGIFIKKILPDAVSIFNSRAQALHGELLCVSRMELGIFVESPLGVTSLLA